MFRRADPVPLRDLSLFDLAAILEASQNRAQAVAAGADDLREKPGTGWPNIALKDERCSPEYAVSYWLLLRRLRGRDLRNRGARG